MYKVFKQTYATNEPLNVIPPMNVPRKSAILIEVAAGSIANVGKWCRYVAKQVLIAARPTSE